MNTYLIQNLYDPNLYWNPQKGWVSRQKAHGFGEDARVGSILPNKGCWLLVSQPEPRIVNGRKYCPAICKNGAHYCELDPGHERGHAYCCSLECLNTVPAPESIVRAAPKLDQEQRIRACLLAESRSLDDETAFELVWLRDREQVIKQLVEAATFALTTPGLIKGRDALCAAITAADPYINPKSEGK